jgi:transcriptional regulator with XRE-family HTH domain
MAELTNEQVEYAVGRLERLIEARGITQTSLAAASGVKQSTISKIITGRKEAGAEKYTPSKEVLTKLFLALGLPLADILHESDEVPEEILGYLATPLTGLTGPEESHLKTVVRTVREIASEKVFEAPRFQIYWPGDHTHPKEHADVPASQVYLTDRSRASTHDFIILFCGKPSYGVGQENEIATQAGVPGVRLVPPSISRMMVGSFARAENVKYSGSLQTGVAFDAGEFRAALTEIRKIYFRDRALYRGMNGDGFAPRLRRLVDHRCGDYEQFARDIGISLSYLHNLMEEPFVVSNPSIRLLKRMAVRLGERVSYLIGESDKSDPLWIDSNASWRSWIDKTPGVEATTAIQMRDDWRNEYAVARREQVTQASHRESLRRMREADWDRRYKQLIKSKGQRGRERDSPSLFRST